MISFVTTYQDDPEHPGQGYTTKIYTHLHQVPSGWYWCFGPEWCDMEHAA